MKYIFLDIDGVLNSDSDFRHPNGEPKARYPHILDYNGISDAKLRQLRRIYDSCGSGNCRIVLTSTWKVYLEQESSPYDSWFAKEAPRIKRYLLGKFRRQGIPIYGTTHAFEANWIDRPGGILGFMKENGIPKGDILILDDERYGYGEAGLLDRVIWTDYEKDGLTPELADRAISLLNGDSGQEAGGEDTDGDVH